MSQINHIREAYASGRRIAQIARDFSIDEKTIRKYLKQNDFSPRIPIQEEHESRLDPYKAKIREWLDSDENVWYKQRHTAQRIHDRLKEEYPKFNLSYPTVQRYVKAYRAKKKQVRTYQELVWHPGEAQVDFGEADFYEKGELIRKKYLTVSFPHSNNGFSQVFGGETSECVCQGLKDIFEYIGGVPHVLVFDNATGVGRRIGEQVREAQLFQQMRAHYGFTARFCNPNAGHEKGHVENKVGYNRRNLFVPLPAYDCIETYNQSLLEAHKDKASEPHYKKGRKIHDLFKEDQQALKRLPGYPFNVCRFLYITADSYGKVRLDGQHYYSTCPEFGGTEVLVGIKAHSIEIYDERGTLTIVHSRCFGTERTDSLDYRTTLATLTKNIGAWSNSGVRDMIPESLRKNMDELCREDLRQTVRTLTKLTRSYSFETAVKALETGFQTNRTHFCDAAVLAARMVEYGLETMPEKGPDLTGYDILLQAKGGQNDFA
jgi:transposase